MTAYTTQLPVGVSGCVSRPDSSIVETVFCDDAFASPYGSPVKLVNGKAVALTNADDLVGFVGFLVRTAPAMGSSSNDALPNVSQAQGLLVGGYANIPVQSAAAPVRGQNVTEADMIAGGGTNTLSGVYWAADGKQNGLAEIFMQHKAVSGTII